MLLTAGASFLSPAASLLLSAPLLSMPLLLTVPACFVSSFAYIWASSIARLFQPTVSHLDPGDLPAPVSTHGPMHLGVATALLFLSAFATLCLVVAGLPFALLSEVG